MLPKFAPVLIIECGATARESGLIAVLRSGGGHRLRDRVAAVGACLSGCQGHANLTHMLLMRLHSPDLKDRSDTMRSAARACYTLANFFKKFRPMGLGGSSGNLIALALAGLIHLSLAAPAFADFASAVTAYERGAYQQAYQEFDALAAAGDERAEPDLKKIRQKLGSDDQPSTSIDSPVGQEQRPDRSTMSSLKDTVISIFSDAESRSFEPESKRITEGSGSSAAGRHSEGTWGSKPLLWEPWMPFEQSS